MSDSWADTEHELLNAANQQAAGGGSYGVRKQRTSLTVQTKLEVIKYAEENPNVTQNKIASHFGIDRTTVSKVLKRKDLFKTVTGSDDATLLDSSMYIVVDNNKAASGRQHVSRRSPPVTSSSQSDSSNVTARYKPLQSNKCSVSNPHDVIRGSDSQQTTLKPREQLYANCESWFVKQKFATLSKKYEKDIIAYSCLISPLPLSIEQCHRIILAKFLMDDAVEWLYQLIRSRSDFAPIG